MLKITKKVLLLIVGAGLVFTSCETEAVGLEEMEESITKTHLKTQSKQQESIPESLLLNSPDPTLLGENLRNAIISDAVEPTECAPTEFVEVQDFYLEPMYSDLYALLYFNLYLDLSFYAAYFDTGEQYFGENGEYTNFMRKRQRELERFWDSPQNIRVNGQHSATLNDREKLADVYELVGANVTTREEAYIAADGILEVNALSPNLPESPFFSIDGFATSANLIVIGDGLVQMIADTGIDSEIVYTGILSHEWAHQVQFSNYSDWYPNGAAEDPAEDTRHTELEADFLASYYMTHKRGATYNWKRVEQFFELFFQIGDCSFSSSGHHGTPAQRMEAARLGYELATNAHKQGHILSEEEAHDYFMAEVDNILN